MQGLLNRGAELRKAELANEYGVAPKTVQRDIDSLRLYLTYTHGGELKYDRKRDCYTLTDDSDNLTPQEIFALCKILIESRAFNKSEFETLINKLLLRLSQSKKQAVEALISNERYNYIPLKHGKNLIERLWDVTEFVTQQKVIEIDYTRQDGAVKSHNIKPVGILFSEFYFYLIAYLADKHKENYTIFRVDRIGNIKDTGEKFSVPYAQRFSEAEFKKRIQFMYAGELKTVRFAYKGVLEAVLDRLPTAEVVEKHKDGGVVIKAEVFGRGVDMWLKSQGDLVEMLG
jgi:predicted DNA-binding transcriptional regulator YafY